MSQRVTFRVNNELLKENIKKAEEIGQDGVDFSIENELYVLTPGQRDGGTNSHEPPPPGP